jgi:hypothetical protein
MILPTSLNSANYSPSSSGGEVWTVAEKNAIILRVRELHQLQGLDSGNPMTVTPSSRTVGAINQVITGDGETTTTVTRV